MKNWWQLFLVFPLVFASLSTEAADASDEYVSIYSLLTKGDEMLSSGLNTEAAQFYSDAHRKLVTFQSANPNWNPSVVKFRLKYLGEKLAGLPMVDAPNPVLTSAPVPNTTRQSNQPADSENLRLLQGQLASANEKLRQLTADNSLLLSKLREAMSARPAEVDPNQYRKAEAKILELEKENELIELQLNRALESKTTQERQIADRQRSQDQATSKEIGALRDAQATSNQTIAELRRQVSDISSRETALKDQVASLTQDLAAAQQAGQSSPAEDKEDSAVAALRAENSRLSQQLRAAEAAQSSSRDNIQGQLAAVSAERDQLKAQLASMAPGNDNRDALEELLRENALLKRQLDDRVSAAGGAASASGESDKVAELEEEVASLRADLDKARRGGSKSRGGWLSRITRRSGNAGISDLEARLAVYEAEKVPYNKDELALLKGVDLAKAEVPVRVGAPLGSAGDNNLSQAAAALEGQAQEAARQGQFGVAEGKFNEILDLIPNHAPTLASLALTQIKQEKFGEAEANLELALDVAPENTYALFLMGLLKMNQTKFDDAVTFLSRASVLDPDDAEAQNHLGVALTEVGHRGPAEAALRKAIRLRPGYADAHVNLAVVYATQKPPFKELAKYHYQQAINNGHPADPRIEQMLAAE